VTPATPPPAARPRRRAASAPLTLHSPIADVPGVGPKKAEALTAIGVRTVFDLCLNLPPKRHEDRTRTVRTAQLVPEQVSPGPWHGILIDSKIQFMRGRMSLTWATFREAAPAERTAGPDSAVASSPPPTLRARWFNLPYIAKSLEPNRGYYLFGTVRTINGQLTFDQPEIEPDDQPCPSPVAGGLTPVYPSSKALSGAHVSPRALRLLIARTLGALDWAASLPEPDRPPFSVIREAMLHLHWPPTPAQHASARHTLDFLLHVLFQLGLLERRRLLTGTLPAGELASDGGSNLTPGTISEMHSIQCMSSMTSRLPFALTGDQQRTLATLLGELRTDQPMNRLLQGEVGSGKTLVSFLAAIDLLTRDTTAQVAFMAPTEILVRQHLRTFARFLPDYAGATAALTGATTAAERRELAAGLLSGRVRILFGTHALLEDPVQFADLRFVIVDEQHRFGVNHRHALVAKGARPHLLVMTATPIPRSLALTVFGDLDVSVIRELPVGRQPVRTQIIDARAAAIAAVAAELDRGRQGYWICPLVQSSRKVDWRSVEAAAAELSAALAPRKVAAITGRLDAATKLATMAAFNAGDIQLLTATTVVEVGIDHPNATIMVIDNPERFGLPQLHQLRGRIGRGREASTCLLLRHAGAPSDEPSAVEAPAARKSTPVSPTTRTPATKAQNSGVSTADDTDGGAGTPAAGTPAAGTPAAGADERLQIFAQTSDGFTLAQYDLDLRGAGDLTGMQQSGFVHPIFSRLAAPEMIEKARRRARQIVTDDPPAHRDWFAAAMAASFGEHFARFVGRD